jgi:hypothetical protein
MNWRPLDVKPDSAGPMTALIATVDEEDEHEFYLMGIYIWRDGRWVDEDTFTPLLPGRYWWVAESEVLKTLPTT